MLLVLKNVRFRKVLHVICIVSLVLTVLSYAILLITALSQGIPIGMVLFAADLGTKMTGISGMSAETSITAILVSQRNLFLIVFIISKLLELYINKRFPEAETTAAPKRAANGKSSTQRVSEGYAGTKGKATNFIAQHKPAATTNPQAQPPIWTKPQAKAQPQKNELDHYTAESSAFARSAPNTSKETDTAANLTRLIKLNSANFALHITNAFAIPGRGVEVVGYLLGMSLGGKRARSPIRRPCGHLRAGARRFGSSASRETTKCSIP